MSITVEEANWNLPESDFHKVTIIPTNYSQKDKTEYYYDTASTFYKYARNKMDIDIYSTPENNVVLKSGDWFGPVIHVGILIIENYPVISALIELTSEYLEKRYLGDDVNVRLEIVAKKNKTTTHVSIKYNGPSKKIDTILASYEKLCADEKDKI